MSPTLGRIHGALPRAVVVTAAAPAPPSLTGRPYVGLGASGPNLLAHKYLGGTYDSDPWLPVDVSSITTGTTQRFALMSIDPLIFAFSRSSPARMYIANFTAGTLAGPFSQDAGGGSSNTRAIYGAGGSGSVYWVRRSTSGDGFFKLWRLDTDGTHTPITPDGSESAPGFDSSSAQTFIFGNETAISPCYGSPAGRIEMGAAHSAFAVDESWLPFDLDNSEWTNWDGYGICGNGDALVLVPFSVSSVSASGIGRVTPAGAFTQLYTQAQLGVAGSSADPSPDGVSAVVWAVSPDQIARVLLDGTTEPEWEAVEDMPEGGTPGQMWCLT
jgi:hypothetical protein